MKTFWLTSLMILSIAFPPFAQAFYDDEIPPSYKQADDEYELPSGTMLNLYLAKYRTRISFNKPEQAIDALIIGLEECNDLVSEPNYIFYHARTDSEWEHYLQLPKSPENAPRIRRIFQNCAEFLSLKGRTYITLSKYGQARKSLAQALKLSPNNARYLNQLGQLYILQKEWSQAQLTFEQAIASIRFSPEELKDAELVLALKSNGYSLYQLGRLDDAEQQYRKALETDSNDQGILKSIQSLEQLRLKK